MLPILYRFLAFVALSLAAGWLLSFADLVPSSLRRSGPSVEQIRTLSALVTVRIDVADVVVTDLRGYTGGVCAIVVVRGDYLLGADLAQARFRAVDESRRTAILRLPSPVVTSSRLDHARTQLFMLRGYGLWQIVPWNAAEVRVVNKAFAQAEDRIRAAAALNPDATERARNQANSVLQCFFEALEWRVTVEWDDSH